MCEGGYVWRGFILGGYIRRDLVKRRRCHGFTCTDLPTFYEGKEEDVIPPEKKALTLFGLKQTLLVA